MDFGGSIIYLAACCRVVGFCCVCLYACVCVCLRRRYPSISLQSTKNRHAKIGHGH